MVIKKKNFTPNGKRKHRSIDFDVGRLIMANCLSGWNSSKWSQALFVCPLHHFRLIMVWIYRLFTLNRNWCKETTNKANGIKTNNIKNKGTFDQVYVRNCSLHCVRKVNGIEVEFQTNESVITNLITPLSGTSRISNFVLNLSL